jgi:hypothetical protein
VGTGFGKESCSGSKVERDDDSRKSHRDPDAAAFPCGDYEIANRLDLPIQPD